MWAAVPENAWLNSPVNILHAEQKFSQLAVAHKLGFTVPDTITTNRWEEVIASLPKDIVFKIAHIYAMYSEPDDIQTVYTTPLTNSQDKLPVQGNPFPGLWQARVDKAREWRITVVGDTTFDAAVYTSEDAKDDWRRHTGKPSAVTFKSEPFPDELKAKCIEYLRYYKLRFGAFDFIEDRDGRIVFLECNTNGQYKWLEDELGFPISSAIACELAGIADGSIS
jgi:glutathione synthase/RimK-type ligase-like ATP-grasp enzyme